MGVTNSPNMRRRTGRREEESMGEAVRIWERRGERARGEKARQEVRGGEER